jgi:hypothetical protein
MTRQPAPASKKAFLFATSSAFASAVAEMIAVPRWSSWKTGDLHRGLSRSSISKHSGAAKSSRLIPLATRPLFPIVRGRKGLAP